MERRKLPRTAVTHIVHYRRVDRDDGDAAIQAHTLNVSDGGLALQTDVPLELDETLAMEIVANPLRPPIQAVGRVSWLREEDGERAAGVEFLWIGCPSLSMATSMMPLVPWPVL